MAEQRREIRDPIHGFIQRSEQEEKIIDSKVFQRLRGIRQLAMAHLVYPGAMHTRFEHSIGVMHIAGRLARQLIEDDETARIIKLTALLHDIGHGPFSHVSEDILEKYYDQKIITLKPREKIHEHLTCRIIEENTEIHDQINKNDRDKIIGYLSGKTGESIERYIISGPLDADKQDYLLRDSYYCGVRYGVFDIDRLIETVTPYQDKYEKLLSVYPNGIYAIEQFILAKYHMTTQVYRHKIRLITDSMIIRAIELGIEQDDIKLLKKLYFYDGSASFIDNYLKWDDERLINYFLYELNGHSLAKNIFQRLKTRNLFKRIFSVPLREFEDASVRDLLSNINDKKQLCQKIETEISEYLTHKKSCKIEPCYVIIKSFSIKSVREQSRNNEGNIIISDDNSTESRNFEEESTLFRSIDERENDQYIEVYAPVVFGDKVEKRKKLGFFSDEIKQILVNGASDALGTKI